MRTYFLSFERRDLPRVRVEFVVAAGTRHEARTIAEKEAAQLKGYRFLGSN
jgi:hypothetical protein